MARLPKRAPPALPTITPEQYFGKLAFAEPHYVSAVFRLVALLLRQYSAQGDTGRYVDVLKEELAALQAAYPLITALPATTRHNYGFPSKGLIPGTSPGLMVVPLTNTRDRARYLSFLLKRYRLWLASAYKEAEIKAYSDAVEGVRVALERLILDHETSNKFTR